MFIVYVLRSIVADKHYVGFTENLERRITEHNSGKSKFTSGYLPWEVIYTEEIEDRVQARKREKYLKSAAGKRFLKHKLRSGGSLPD
jgi:putative endonuclease